MGIIVPERDKNNYRNYSENDLLKLRQLILLKEMGIPLRKINSILQKDFDEENKMVKILDIQLKVVENKINELKNIKNTLELGINDILNKNVIDYNTYFDKVDRCLKENIENGKTESNKFNVKIFKIWWNNYYCGFNVFK